MTSENHPPTGGHTVEPDPQRDKAGRTPYVLVFVFLGVPSIAIAAYLGLLVIGLFTSDMPLGLGEGEAFEGPGYDPGFGLMWSSAGDHIVFYNNSYRYTATVDGSALHLLDERESEIVDYYPFFDISPDGSRIVYATTRYGQSRNPDIRRNSEIETARLDGSDRQRITTSQAYDHHPVWSPNGNRFALLRYPYYASSDLSEETGGLYSMAVDGSDLRLLLSFEALSASSPDTNGESAINPEPGLIPGFYPPHIEDRPPIWAPSGEMLAFLGYEYPPGSYWSRGYAIYVIDHDGSDLSVAFGSSGVIVEDQSDDDSWFYVADDIVGAPAWSPDGKKLAFLRYIKEDYAEFMGDDYPIHGEPGLAVYEISIDGTGLRNIASIGAPYACDGAVAWSPDGSKVLISHLRHSDDRRSCTAEDELAGLLEGYVLVTGIDGNGYQQVGKGANAVWSPDGSRIAVHNPFSEDALYTVDPDGANLNVLVRREEDGDFVPANRPWYRFW